MPVTPPPPGASPDVWDAYHRALERENTEGFRPVRADGNATARNLRRLAREHERFLDHHNPITLSLRLAAIRTKEELESRAEGLERLPDGEIVSIPAIVLAGEAMMLKAVRGDVSAFAQVADRMEGRVGTRKGETAEEGVSREQMGDIIETLINAYTNNGRSRPEQVVDVEVISEDAARVMRDQRVSADTSARDAEARRLNAEEAHNDDSNGVATGYTNGHSGNLND